MSHVSHILLGPICQMNKKGQFPYKSLPPILSTVIAYISRDLINGQKDEHILVIHHPFTRQRHQAAEFITECNQCHSD